MDIVPIILVAGSLVYLCRLAGFTLDLSGVSSRREQFLRFIPLCVLSALITLSVLHEPEFMGIKAAALMIATGIIWKTRRKA